MDFTNRIELSCFGMRRSGNHAFVNWVRSQTTGKFLHINNAKIYTSEDPYDRFAECTTFAINPLVTERGLRGFKRFIKYALHRGQVEYIYAGYGAEGQNIDREALRQQQKSLLVHSYEHYLLEDVLEDWLKTDREKFLGTSQYTFDVVLLRDPFNLFASLIKRNEDFSKPYSAINKWKSHAREYLGYTNYLEHKVAVSYNSWFQDKEYRRNLADCLKVDFTDAGLNSVPIFGNGSSFEGQSFNGSAQQMGVLSRYKKFLDHPVMKRVMADEEVRELAHEAFGDILDSAETVRS